MRFQRDAVLETEDQVAFGEYLALLDYKLDRREELDRRIEALTLEASYNEPVGRLCCLKGFSTQAAMVLVMEIRDFRRFEHPGSITKAGNSRARHVLVHSGVVLPLPVSGEGWC